MELCVCMYKCFYKISNLINQILSNLNINSGHKRRKTTTPELRKLKRQKTGVN